MSRKRVAVVGAGVSGLGAAWLLARGGYAVTLFEADSCAGGHAHTVDLDIPGCPRPVPIDTGFIVYNTRTYPDFVSLLELLRIPQDNSSMSFAASVQLPDGIGGGGPAATAFEWGSDSLAALLADGRNLTRGALYTMLWDMRRFNTAVYAFVQHVERYPEAPEAAYSLADFLTVGAYSPVFVHAYLIPMVSAVWSASFRSALQFPARALLRFFVNHGLAQVFARPQWRTPLHRSREYVAAVLADIVSYGGVVNLSTRVTRVLRGPSGVEVTVSHRAGDSVESQSSVARDDEYDPNQESGTPLIFDQVVFATHADTTLQILGDGASAEERRILGVFQYSTNIAYVHTDPTLMPAARATWSSWNFILRREGHGTVQSSGTAPDSDSTLESSSAIADRPVCVTYWLNKLQNLNRRAHHELMDLFLTLNPCVPIDPGTVLAEKRFEHPQFTEEAVSAQTELQNLIQGENRTWFCGAYARYGFHEDGLMTGLDVAERLSEYKVLRPWRSKEALAINNNYHLYELPFATPRYFGIAYMSALCVINFVGSRVHAGLSKYADRLTQSDPSVILSDGVGLLLRYGRTTPGLTKPGLVNVRSPRLFARITDAIRHHRELAPVAVSAFVSGELDVPMPSDLTAFLQALIVAQRRGPELGHGVQGQMHLAETLLHALVGGFEAPRPPTTSSRLPELAFTVNHVVFPCWWSSESAGNGGVAMRSSSQAAATSIHKGVGTAIGASMSQPRNILEVAGDLCESTVAKLRANPSWLATIVVAREDSLNSVRSKAKLLHVVDQVRLLTLTSFLPEQTAPVSCHQGERYDHIVSPSILNLCDSMFPSISHLMSYLYDMLAQAGGTAELGFTAVDELRVQGSRNKKNCDAMYSGEPGFHMWSSREVLQAADSAGFRLDELSHMEACDAAKVVQDTIEHVFSTLAAETLSTVEIRELLGQFCLWQAALAVGVASRTVIVLRKPAMPV